MEDRYEGERAHFGKERNDSTQMVFNWQPCHTKGEGTGERLNSAGTLLIAHANQIVMTKSRVGRKACSFRAVIVRRARGWRLHPRLPIRNAVHVNARKY